MSSQFVDLFLPLGLLALVAWFLIIRPARKRQADFRATQSALEVGAKVLLSSGIYGTIEAIRDEKISLRVSDYAVIEVHRGAISQVIPAAEPQE